jgi:hypothetical protein
MICCGREMVQCRRFVDYPTRSNKANWVSGGFYGGKTEPQRTSYQDGWACLTCDRFVADQSLRARAASGDRV